MSNIILRRVPTALCESEVLPLDTHPVSRPMAVLASRVKPVEAASLIRFLANTHEAVESRRDETLRQLARQQTQQVRVQAAVIPRFRQILLDEYQLRGGNISDLSGATLQKV